MSCGGFRQGAGRKSTWASGCTFNDTKLIRVPSKIATILLELAHKIDAGESIEEIFGNLTPDDLQKLDGNLNKHKIDSKTSVKVSNSIPKQLSIYDFLK